MTFKRFYSVLSGLLLCAGFGVSMAASPVIEPEHTRNLRNLEMAPMLFEYHRQTIGDKPQYFTYPRRDTTFRKNFVKDSRWKFIALGLRNTLIISLFAALLGILIGFVVAQILIFLFEPLIIKIAMPKMPPRPPQA